MSRLEELIQNLCPDGVQFETLDKIAVRTKGTPITAAQMKGLDKPNAPVKIFAGGKTVAYFDYADLPEKDVNTYPSVIVKSRGVIEFEYYDKPFSHKNEMWSYHIERDDVDIMFLYYFLKTQEGKLREKATSMGAFPQIAIPDTEKLVIPLPPLPVQEEIVRILDTLSGVVAELEQKLNAEQAARVRQYDHYRNQLFDITDDDSVSCIPLESVIISLKTGLNPRKNFQLNTEDAKNHYVTVRELAGKDIRIFDKTDKVNDEALRLINNRSNLEVNDILFSGTGTVGRTAIVQEPPINWNIKEGVYVIKPDTKKINPFYLLYLLQSDVMKKKYEGKIVGSPVISLPMYELRKLLIPLPPLEVQEQIVSILDRFDTLVNDLKSGLPAEIALRRKQYEYYRNHLFSYF